MAALSELRFLVIISESELSSQLLIALKGEGARKIDVIPDFALAISTIKESFFDCIVIDRDLGSGDGIVLAPIIKRLNPRSAIFLLSTSARWATIDAAKELGFSALLKRESAAEIASAIIRIVRSAEGSFQSKLELLTVREREILKDISSGKRTLEISATRHISEGTIKSHLSSIYRKLGVRNRVEAIAAIKN